MKRNLGYDRYSCEQCCLRFVLILYIFGSTLVVPGGGARLREKGAGYAESTGVARSNTDPQAMLT